MTLASRILLGVAVALLVVGVGLAVFQPGSLRDGSSESAGSTSTTTAITSSTTTGLTTTAPTTTMQATSSTSTSTTSAPGSTSSSSTTAPAGSSTTTTTAAGGGGTGGGGSGFADGSTAEPSDTSNGLANTGGRSLIFAGVLAGAAGLALRPRRQD